MKIIALLVLPVSRTTITIYIVAFRFTYNNYPRKFFRDISHAGKQLPGNHVLSKIHCANQNR